MWRGAELPKLARAVRTTDVVTCKSKGGRKFGSNQPTQSMRRFRSGIRGYRSRNYGEGPAPKFLGSWIVSLWWFWLVAVMHVLAIRATLSVRRITKNAQSNARFLETADCCSCAWHI